jgi:hypothetical protein
MREYNIFTAAYIVSIIVACAALYITWRIRKSPFALPFLVVGIVGVFAGVYFFWYTHRPLPTPEQRTLFPGIEYVRDIRTTPVPMVIHVVRIDMQTPGLNFLVTPDGGLAEDDLLARTTSQFLQEFDLQLAINGDFFDPWRDYGIWDYYPHEGDPVNIRGLTASNGDIYTTGYAPREDYVTMYITPDHRVSFNEPPDEIANAISGNGMLLFAGERMYVEGAEAYLYERHPRAAIGVDQQERILLIVLVDGRQPSYSDGVTLPEMGQIALDYGGYHMINLDGGGSVTLAIEGEDEMPQVLNSPIHNRIPGRERPIANHFGIYVGQNR